MLIRTNAWELRKLGEVVEFFSGLTYSPQNVIHDAGVLVLRSSNIRDGEIVDADNVYVEPTVAISRKIRNGDIIVVVRNGSRGLIGKHAKVKKNLGNAVIGAFMAGIRAKRSDFINATLDTQKFNLEINRNLGATINQITNKNFKNMCFYIPSDIEQQKIGSFFKHLDELITLHQRRRKISNNRID